MANGQPPITSSFPRRRESRQPRVVITGLLAGLQPPLERRSVFSSASFPQKIWVMISIKGEGNPVASSRLAKPCGAPVRARRVDRRREPRYSGGYRLSAVTW